MGVFFENRSDSRYARFKETPEFGVFLQPGISRSSASQATEVCRGAALNKAAHLWNPARHFGNIARYPTPFFSIYSSPMEANNEYQNEYQTDPDRFVPIGADTGRLLSKNHKNTPKTGLRRPIPTSASNLNHFGTMTCRDRGGSARTKTRTKVTSDA